MGRNIHAHGRIKSLFVLILFLKLNFTQAQSVKFKVDEVKLNISPIPVYPFDTIISFKSSNKVVFVSQSLQKTKLYPSYNHGLIDAVHLAFSSHRPLTLSPDIVWLTICQGVSLHMNLKFDSLKSTLFKSEKPVKLLVNNDFIEQKPEEWIKVINEFANMTSANTKADYYNIFVPQFSTTSKDITTAYQINLMETYKQAFEYLGESGCGIPFINLEGKKEDWQKIYVQLEEFRKFGLGVWVDELKPVIQQFINTYDRKIEKEFWSDIYKDYSEYGAFYISGWIIKFFPYTIENEEYHYEQSDTTFSPVPDEDEESRETVYNPEEFKVKKLFKPNQFLKKSDYLMSTLSIDNFPSGIAEVDVKWNNHFTNTTTEYLLNAGFVGIQQLNDKSVKPFISWLVTKKAEKGFLVEQLQMKDEPAIKHTDRFWTPLYADTLNSLAVYNLKKYKTAEESTKYISELIKDSIISHVNQFTEKALKTDFEFVVLQNGTITQLHLNSNENIEGLSIFIQKILIQLPEKWFPATAKVKNVIDMYEEGTNINALVKVKSKVRIVIN